MHKWQLYFDKNGCISTRPMVPRAVPLYSILRVFDCCRYPLVSRERAMPNSVVWSAAIDFRRPPGKSQHRLRIASQGPVLQGLGRLRHENITLSPRPWFIHNIKHYDLDACEKDHKIARMLSRTPLPLLLCCLKCSDMNNSWVPL